MRMRSFFCEDMENCSVRFCAEKIGTFIGTSKMQSASARHQRLFLCNSVTVCVNA
jgi:hypothetical protein